MPAPESNTRKIFARLKRGVSCAAGSFQPLPRMFATGLSVRNFG